MHVAFINENTLGHASYLLPFADTLTRCPELGVAPHVIHATPLPPELRTRADFTVPGLRRWGLDFHNARWRLTVSHHVRRQLDDLGARQPVDAVVVNTQSVALELADVAAKLPVFVCLDATFAQLARTRWFAPNVPSRFLLPLTSAVIRRRERTLFHAARRLLPWSQAAQRSLVGEYEIAPEKISLLPPSVEIPPRRPEAKARGTRPQLLFVGGDFRRKGGPLLLDCYRRHLAGGCDLHIVTETKLAPEAGVRVHRGVKHGSELWRELWRAADLFVFPSTLDTFGIVLIEALAFGVPVISADVGAAREVLDEGHAGTILFELSAASLRKSVEEFLSNPKAFKARIERGRQIVDRRYNLNTNAAQLAAWLKEAAA